MVVVNYNVDMIIKLYTSLSMNSTGIDSSWVTDLESFWKSWNLRIFVILSFFIQGFLIIGAAFRKQRTSRALIGFLWLAYVLADWAAYYALGLISNSTSYCTTTKVGNLHGFWAPFLLLHLGGPSTITAFSLDDTSFWVRSTLNLVVQTLAAVIAFVDLLPNNSLWVASLFIFFAAIIRYSDRVISLYIASTTRSNISDTLRKPQIGTTRSLETVVEAEEPLTTWGDLSDDVQLGKNAYALFDANKGLYGDLFYTYTKEEWTQSKSYLSRLDAAKAFGLMEIEFSLAYEVFYTKISLIQSWIERILYPFSTACVIVAFVLWIITSKDEYNTVDIVITYALLIGALIVDVFSAVVILISDWMITFLITSNKARYFTPLSKALISIRIRRWASTRNKKKGIKQPYFWSTMFSKIFFPHWSESILQLNMVDYCFNSKVNQSLILKYYQIIDYPTNANVTEVDFTAELRDFIFREIQERGESELVLGKSDKLCSSKARWILKKYYTSNTNNSINASIATTKSWNPFAEAFNGIEFDERLLVLHVATDLLFRTNVGATSTSDANQQHQWREISKVLSNYMFYLLVLQQKMIFVPGCLWQTLFPEMCNEFKRISKDSRVDKSSKSHLDEQSSEKFLEKGVKSENKVISRACVLATTLKHYEERRWEILSKVWMELACHSASHSRGSAHAAQLSRGGELFTFIWLMLTHFKIGKQFIYMDDDEDDDENVNELGKAVVAASPSTTGGEDNWPFETA